MGLLSDFKQFVLRGNITDLAIGFTVGAAFTTVVKSAVEDLVMPPVGLLVGEVDFTQQFWVLAPGKNGEAAFETMAQAKAAGAVTLNYGNFINNCIALLVVALVMFAVVKFIRRVETQTITVPRYASYLGTVLGRAAFAPRLGPDGGGSRRRGKGARGAGEQEVPLLSGDDRLQGGALPRVHE